MKSMPIVGRFGLMGNYVLVTVEYVVDETVYYWGFAHGLVTQEHDLVLQQGWDAPFA